MVSFIDKQPIWRFLIGGMRCLKTTSLHTQFMSEPQWELLEPSNKHKSTFSYYTIACQYLLTKIRHSATSTLQARFAYSVLGMICCAVPFDAVGDIQR